MKSKRITNWTDIVISILMYALAIFIFVETADMRESAGNALNPDTWPRILAVLLAVCSTVLLINVFRGKVSTDIHIDNKPEVFISIALLILYALCMKTVGFIICNSVLILGILLIFKIRKPLPLILIPLLTTGFIYILFHIMLKVPLPAGWLSFIL